MNLSDLMEGLREAAKHNSKFVETVLTKVEIAPILAEFDVLREDNERLQTRYDSATDQAVRYAAEVERLMAEIECCDKQCTALRAEVKRLRALEPKP